MHQSMPKRFKRLNVYVFGETKTWCLEKKKKKTQCENLQ